MKNANEKGTSFPSLSKKIWWTLFILPAILIFLIAAVSASVLAYYLDADYRSAIADSVSLAGADFASSLGILNDELLVLASDEDVTAFAADGSDPSKTATAAKKLTAAKNDNPIILGITLYGNESDAAAVSSGVSGYPNRSRMLSDPLIASFVAGSLDHLFLIRDTNIADNFGFISYDESFGILSLFVRIQSGSPAEQAFLTADLDSQYLYASFFDYSSCTRFVAADTIISSGSIYLRSATNSAFASYFPFSQSGVLANLDFSYSYFRQVFPDYSVATIVENSKPRLDTLILIGSAAGIAVVLTAADFFFATAIRRRMIGRLDGMVEKLKGTTV